MKHSFIIIDDDPQSLERTHAMLSSFPNLQLVASAQNYDLAIDAVLEFRPDLIFLEIEPSSAESGLNLQFVTELYRYLRQIPKIIITTKNPNFAFDALRLDVFDYLLKPLSISELRKTILKYERHDEGIGKLQSYAINTVEPIATSAIFASNEAVSLPADIDGVEIESISANNPSDINIAVSENDPEGVASSIKEELKPAPLIICVKSYGDYRFIEAREICYLKADNNSTDIHLISGEMITAFKTLKHFETQLSPPFVRIHNSYIVNINYVSRIHTGNSVCYIKNTTTKLPFSKTYKDNIDAIISNITTGNYLEI